MFGMLSLKIKHLPHAWLGRYLKVYFFLTYEISLDMIQCCILLHVFETSALGITFYLLHVKVVSKRHQMFK